MFQRILCATDFSDTADTAWAAARELARTHRAELILVHVFTELPVYPDVAVPDVYRVWEEQRAWAESTLAERASAAAGLSARWVLKTGTAPESIVETAVETSERLTSTIGDSPVTVTVSETVAGFSAKLMVAVWSMMRTMSGRDSVVNPVISDVRE